MAKFNGNFCSIDASTTSLAYAIFSNGELKDCGKILFNGVTVYDKIKDAVEKVFIVFDPIEIDFVVIERSIFLNSPKTMSELSMMQGAIMTLLASAGVGNCFFVPPITWQNFIGNKALTKEEKLKIRNENPDRSSSWYKTFERNYRKLRTIRFVNINYDLDIDDNDMADAIGIGHYVINNVEKMGG